jgi:hypothetical protein
MRLRCTRCAIEVSSAAEDVTALHEEKRITDIYAMRLDVTKKRGIVILSGSSNIIDQWINITSDGRRRRVEFVAFVRLAFPFLVRTGKLRRWPADISSTVINFDGGKGPKKKENEHCDLTYIYPPAFYYFLLSRFVCRVCAARDAYTQDRHPL